MQLLYILCYYICVWIKIYYIYKMQSNVDNNSCMGDIYTYSSYISIYVYMLRVPINYKDVCRPLCLHIIQPQTSPCLPSLRCRAAVPSSTVLPLRECTKTSQWLNMYWTQKRRDDICPIYPVQCHFTMHVCYHTLICIYI